MEGSDIGVATGIERSRWHDERWVGSRIAVRGTGRRKTLLKITNRSDDQTAVAKEKSKSRGRKQVLI